MKKGTESQSECYIYMCHSAPGAFEQMTYIPIHTEGVKRNLCINDQKMHVYTMLYIVLPHLSGLIRTILLEI